MAGQARHSARAGAVRPETGVVAAAKTATLIRDYPCAWLFALGSEETGPSLVTFRGIHDAHGRLRELVGQVAATNPLCAAFECDPSALILFQGWDTSSRQRRDPHQPGVSIYADVWLEHPFPDEQMDGEIILNARVSHIQRMTDYRRR